MFHEARILTATKTKCLKWLGYVLNWQAPAHRRSMHTHHELILVIYCMGEKKRRYYFLYYQFSNTDVKTYYPFVLKNRKQIQIYLNTA